MIKIGNDVETPENNPVLKLVRNLDGEVELITYWEQSPWTSVTLFTFNDSGIITMHKSKGSLWERSENFPIPRREY